MSEPHDQISGQNAHRRQATTDKKTARADSGVASTLESPHLLSDASNHPSRTKGHHRHSSSKRSSSYAHGAPRKPSAASTRSSSNSAQRRKSREHHPRRLHSSPAAALPRSNIEDAIAFHKRSCQLMQNMSLPPSQTLSSVLQQKPAPPIPHAQTEEKYCAPAAETNMQWMCDETRQQQYAAIDKRNSGIRKLLRKLMPTCMSSQNMIDFYNEDDDSDAGSVRRYRLKMDEKN